MTEKTSKAIGQFLWPDVEPFQWRDFSLHSSFVTHDAIEAFFVNLYPQAHAVLTSSARAAIHLLLEHLNVSRPDIVWCPDFSSHCVFDAISRLGTPTTTTIVQQKRIKVALLYHQWGTVHQAEFNEPICVIEDSADSLFIPGSNVFSAAGEFVICSLPKVIASHFGGVIFCRDQSTANALRERRDRRAGHNVIQSGLKLASSYSDYAGRLWQGSEALSGTLSYFAREEIWRKLQDFERLIEIRMHKLSLVSDNLKNFAQQSGRIPCCLPLDIDSIASDYWDGSQPSIATGFRNFNVSLRMPDTQWQSVAPLPLHQTMPDSVLKTIRNLQPRDLLGVL